MRTFTGDIMASASTIRKANKLVSEGRVFMFAESVRIAYFVVGGFSDTYMVNFNKVKNSWSCTCRNVRDVDCSHILACKRVYDEEHK